MSKEEDLVRDIQDLPLDVVYLFGSQLDGTTAAVSDVDIGILPGEAVTEEDRLLLQARVSAIAADCFKVDHADVVLVDEAPPGIAMAVIRGKVLLCRSEARRVAIEARVMAEYHDRAHHRERWYREVPPRWARGEFA